jgi:hypothetical protein
MDPLTALSQVAIAILPRFLPTRRPWVLLPTGRLIRDRRRRDRRARPMVWRGSYERRSGADRRQRAPAFVPA